MVAYDAAANLQYGLQQVLARRKAGEAETTLVISKIATIRAKILGCGCAEIWLWTSPDVSTRAYGLYRKFGWQDCGVQNGQRIMKLKTIP